MLMSAISNGVDVLIFNGFSKFYLFSAQITGRKVTTKRKSNGFIFPLLFLESKVNTKCRDF